MRETNPYRTESVTKAKKIDVMLKKVWQKHKHYIQLKNDINKNFHIIYNIVKEIIK